MKGRVTKWALTAVAVLLATPLAARAAVTTIYSSNACTTGSLILCNAFEVTFDGTSTYHLLVTNNSAGSTVPDAGFITGVGIFNNTSSTYTFTVTGGIPTGWTDAVATSSSTCNDLGGPDGQSAGDLVLGVCYNGATTTQMLDISFTSNVTLSAADFGSNGDLLIMGDHVQGLGTCSAKFYSDGAVGTSSGTSLDTCYGSTVPEPVSSLLFATGLLGLGAIRRRRRGVDVENG